MKPDPGKTLLKYHVLAYALCMIGIGISLFVKWYFFNWVTYSEWYIRIGLIIIYSAWEMLMVFGVQILTALLLQQSGVINSRFLYFLGFVAGYIFFIIRFWFSYGDVPFFTTFKILHNDLWYGIGQYYLINFIISIITMIRVKV